MSYKLVLTKRVHEQLVNTLDWYAEHAKGHEIKLLKSFDNALSFIEKNPLKCQVRYDDIRIYFMDTYQFGIHYFLDKQTIYILGLFHQHQSDDSWKIPE